MTIRKGEEWGALGPAPGGMVLVSSDAELFAVVNRAVRPPAVGLLAGDLACTVGASGDRSRLTGAGEVAVLPVDVCVAHHDGGTHRFVAHAVARRSWWHGPLLGIFNAQFRGSWDVVPRSHPNDGRVDVVEVDAAMGLRQRWAARSRLPTGSHLPHPHIRTRRITEGEWTFERPTGLWLDGVAVGRTRHLRVVVEPDALTVCV